MSTTSRLAWAWLPACAYMGLIWFVSSAPHDFDIQSFPLRDKGVHLLEYGTLGALLARAVVRSWPSAPRLRALTMAVVLTGLWGFLDEVHQGFVPGRHADVWDLVADVAGGTLGMLVYAAVVHVWSLRNARA